MSYKTVEVELKNGMVSPVGADTLPAEAHALLTILNADGSAKAPASDRPLTERVSNLAGIGRGQHSDLSTNPSHLDDFGR